MHIIEEVKKRGKMIDGLTDQLLPIAQPEELYLASRHLIEAGGKRLRPAMLILATEAVGGNVQKVLPAAFSIELIHNFTLIHDDIMDQDILRRGCPTVHIKWGLPAAILAGDTLYSKAVEILAGVDAPPSRIIRCLNILSSTCTEICEGQWMDMVFEGLPKVSEAEYMKMVEKKTGVLFAAATSIGGILGGCNEDEAKALWEIGRITGIAFQIRDDVLDLITPEERLGKERGSDLMEGKKTLIRIHALKKGVKLDHIKRGSSDEEIEAAVQALRDAGSIDYAMKKARKLVAQGKAKLDMLPDSKAKILLKELADYLVMRTY
ncbi:MAG: polyprenyl synthetase family protein [Methanocellales archaeon]|nr:polyprenyl synthetase family protein [Methanocellales archaeon]